MHFCFMSEMLAVMSGILVHFELQGASFLVLKTILFEVRNAIGSSGLERIDLEHCGFET